MDENGRRYGWWIFRCLSMMKRIIAGRRCITRLQRQKMATKICSRAIRVHAYPKPTTWCSTAGKWVVARCVFINKMCSRKYLTHSTSVKKKHRKNSASCLMHCNTVRLLMAAWRLGWIVWLRSWQVQSRFVT